MRSIAWQVIPGHFQLRYFGVKECLDASVSRCCQNLHKGRIAIGAYGSPEIESFALRIELRPDEVDGFPYISFDFRRDRSLDSHFKETLYRFANQQSAVSIKSRLIIISEIICRLI